MSHQVDKFNIYAFLGIGPKNGLTLYLDAHTQTGLYKAEKSKNKTFTLSLQHFENFPLLSLGGVVVKTGQKTRYNILAWAYLETIFLNSIMILGTVLSFVSFVCCVQAATAAVLSKREGNFFFPRLKIRDRTAAI